MRAWIKTRRVREKERKKGKKERGQFRGERETPSDKRTEKKKKKDTQRRRISWVSPSPDSWYLIGKPRQVQLFEAKGLASLAGGGPLWGSAEAASAAVATEVVVVEVRIFFAAVGGREARRKERSGASAETPALLEALLLGATTG